MTVASRDLLLVTPGCLSECARLAPTLHAEATIDVVKMASQISLSRPVAYLCRRLAINV
jgi:hypothetical protein